MFHRISIICVMMISASEVAAQSAPMPGNTVLHHYGGLTGAWVLNMRCHQWSARERKEYEWHYRTITQWLVDSGHGTAAKKVRATALYSSDHPRWQGCGPGVVRVIREGTPLARMISRRQTGKTYNSAAFKTYPAYRLGYATAYLQLGQKCKFARGPRLTRLYNGILDKLLERFNNHVLNRQMDIGRLKIHPIVRMRCGADARRAFRGGVADIRAFARELGVR